MSGASPGVSVIVQPGPHVDMKAEKFSNAVLVSIANVVAVAMTELVGLTGFGGLLNTGPNALRIG